MVYCRFPSMVIICNYFYQNKQVKVVLVILSNFIFGKKITNQGPICLCFSVRKDILIASPYNFAKQVLVLTSDKDKA